MYTCIRWRNGLKRKEMPGIHNSKGGQSAAFVVSVEESICIE